jgi:hypothetical protein
VSSGLKRHTTHWQIWDWVWGGYALGGYQEKLRAAEEATASFYTTYVAIQARVAHDGSRCPTHQQLLVHQSALLKYMAESRALSFGDVLLREADVELLQGPHWLNDQVGGVCSVGGAQSLATRSDPDDSPVAQL